MFWEARTPKLDGIVEARKNGLAREYSRSVNKKQQT